MITALRTELYKIRTIRTPLGLLGAAVGLTALGAILRSSRAGTSGHMAIAPLYTQQGLSRVLTGTDIAMLLAMVLGVVIASGEFRHRTATDTYLATPNRTVVLVAKAASALVVGAMFGVLASAITTTVGLSFVAAKGYAVALSGATIARFALGAILGSALLAAGGVAIGSLIRGQIGAIVATFAWAFVIEQIIGGIFNSVAPYLPVTAANTLGGTNLGGGVSPLPFAAAAALVAGVVIVLGTVAARTTVQHDVV